MTHCHTLLQSLRTMGYRITPQREMIVEAIAHANGHVTAEEIYAQVKERTRYVNLATVYRTLELLVEKGLSSRADLWDGRVVYATLLHGPHIHLVCRQCGGISLADSNLLEELGEQLSTQYDFTADLGHLSIIGVCANCREKDLKGLQDR
jgi:Fur family ferric uptake transcriptional regulator